ncbi:LysE family translocator [Gottfriedia acidiceleris]|uniref:LysE family translocator n=1 Tax=Gottfriedia acidiceleris TaxID=371036 RepID=UPI003D23AE2A
MTEYTVFMLAFAASAAAPGPEIAGLMSRSLSSGILSSIPLSIGIILGKLLMLTGAVIGLTALVEALGPMFEMLKYLGAAYLVWIGIKKWRKAGQVFDENVKTKSVDFVAEIGLGLAMTLSNPIAIVFYMALLPGVIDVSGITLNTYTILCLIIIIVMSVVVSSYGLMAEIARKLFSSSKSKAHIDRISGAMMFGAALWILTR